MKMKMNSLIRLSDIKAKFGGKYPPKDKKFISLFKKAIQGKIPYHWALIKKEAIKPFSDYKPKIPESLRKNYLERVNKSDFPSIHVYEEGTKYIMSDDYIKYYFYLDLCWPEIPCMIIGSTTGNFTRHLTRAKAPKIPRAHIVEDDKKPKTQGGV